MTEDKLRAQIAELEDRIKQRDRRIDELKAEKTEVLDTADSLREQVEDLLDLQDRWIEVFELVPDDDGKYSYADGWNRLVGKYNALLETHNKLVRQWNRYVGDRYARDPGRPLAASDEQVKRVRKMRKDGESLRNIAGKTGLGLRTVRTIIEQEEAVAGRTSKRLEDRRRREIARLRQAEWRARKRTVDDFPKRLAAVLDGARDAVKAAKGIGKT